MDPIALAFEVAGWQWAVAGVAAVVLVAGLVLRQIQRKKAGL